MRARLQAGALILELDGEHRCLSSAVLGGGMGRVRSFVNITVPRDYARRDPGVHAASVARQLGAPAPVVGMLTAVEVSRYREHGDRGARAYATVGVGHPLAAAGRRPRLVAPVGTINLFVVVDQALSDAALAGAMQTAVEAKVQALADAQVPAGNAVGYATGTATDCVCIAAPRGEGLAFAGPATAVGASIARAVHGAVLAGALEDRARCGGRLGSRDRGTAG
jgi:adenosylcobinamide amidohydrolase